MVSIGKVSSVCLLLSATFAFAVGSQSAAAKDVIAKQLFGTVKDAADLKPAAHGTYTRGCLAGGRRLAEDGEAWQAMRLSRNRNWGHPNLVAYVERLARDAKKLDGWPGLLVGDLAQPRGGPMLTGHASHQLGLDADIWMLPAPGRTYTKSERENVSSISVVKNRREINSKTWTTGHAKLLKRAASYNEVARIFVNPPIKKALCKWAKGDRGWLRKIRAWYGHTYHFHVRLKCPRDSKGCRDQGAPPSGDGCGSELKWWLSDGPYKKKKPTKFKPELKLSDLPKACKSVLK